MAKRNTPKLDWGPMGAFVLPKALMAHPDFRELSGSALKVLMLLGSQYNGHNNGDLAATHTMMGAWGGMAKATLAAALRELQERNLIARTRQHNRSRDGARPALFAFTWLPIDECPGKGLEVSATVVSARSLRL
ncbi:MarR family transcriptional regulator [Stutzerimonas urumqiensis]|uniref:MarR family transcriptional regulator n=1 Tax=Stutzerimonas urumqiensis TaxID=638269 RepID=UPI000EAF48D9|nr:MarR family transcriptional regulator [Stutzerimonas urumqiensis]